MVIVAHKVVKLNGVMDQALEVVALHELLTHTKYCVNGNKDVKFTVTTPVATDPVTTDAADGAVLVVDKKYWYPLAGKLADAVHDTVALVDAIFDATKPVGSAQAGSGSHETSSIKTLLAGTPECLNAKV